MKWGRDRNRRDDTETALANFALTFAKALLVISVTLIVLITDDNKKDNGIKPKAEAVIIVDWSGDVKTDVDTWLRLPTGEIIYYANKTARNVFLDRDDLGTACFPVCEEITTLRAMESGEYVLNLNVFHAPHMMNTDAVSPIPVHIQIIRLNPIVVVRWQGDVTLIRDKEEKHIVRFTIANNDFITFDDTRPVQLMNHYPTRSDSAATVNK